MDSVRNVWRRGGGRFQKFASLWPDISRSKSFSDLLIASVAHQQSRLDRSPKPLIQGRHDV